MYETLGFMQEPNKWITIQKRLFIRTPSIVKKITRLYFATNQPFNLPSIFSKHWWVNEAVQVCYQYSPPHRRISEILFLSKY